jgi:hypothetical protein
LARDEPSASRSAQSAYLLHVHAHDLQRVSGVLAHFRQRQTPVPVLGAARSRRPRRGKMVHHYGKPLLLHQEALPDGVALCPAAASSHCRRRHQSEVK